MADKRLASAVQLIANFNDLAPSISTGWLIWSARDGASVCSRVHGLRNTTSQPVPSNPLSLRIYRRREGDDTTPAPVHRGCSGIPVGWCPSGCHGLQAVDNRRWSMVLDRIPDGRWRRRKSPTLSRASTPPHIIAATRQTAMMFLPTCPRMCPSPTRRSLCFVPSSPPKSAPSSMATTKQADLP